MDLWCHQCRIQEHMNCWTHLSVFGPVLQGSSATRRLCQNIYWHKWKCKFTMILMVLPNSNVQKKNQLSGRKEENLHFWCRSQQRERLRTQKKGHTTVSMLIVVLCVKVSAHEWSKLTRARSEIYAFQCGHAGVRKTSLSVLNCWLVIKKLDQLRRN